ASILHHRLQAATSRPRRGGVRPTRPRLIVGLIPEATGPIAEDMAQALNDRRQLIEQRATQLLANAIYEDAPWLDTLGPKPTQSGPAATTWRQAALALAAYRDRYQITGSQPFGPPPTTIGQRRAQARANALLRTHQTHTTPGRQPQTPPRHGPNPRTL
ncbi:MAG: hypothetical protein LBG11_06145, partial [Bifidobacteriaceae bacterium]|nr:hypothetical protein [Bifidobacteriaceae bacterium]